MSHSSVRTEYEKRIVSLQKCLHELQKQETFSGLAKAALAFLQEWFPFELIWLARYDAENQILVGLDGILPKSKDLTVLSSQQPVLPGDLFDQALLTGQVQNVVSLDQESRSGVWQSLAQYQGIQGASILPIRYRKTSFGVLMVGTKLWGGHSRSEEIAELKILTNALGSALSTVAGSAQQPTPSESQPFVEIVSSILSAKTFAERLKQVLEVTYQSIQPSRVCLYWIDIDEQVCRLQEIYSGPPLRKTTVSKPTVLPEVSLQHITPFYQAALQNQTIAIADVDGLIHSHSAPTRLMTLTQSRAWLSVPIFNRGQLVGVLAVEGNKPRVWSEANKQYLKLMAQLMNQSFNGDPDSAPLWTVGQNHLPSLLNALREADLDAGPWEKTLQQCLEQVSQQFAVRWVALLHHDPEEQTFDCRSQFCVKKKQPLPILPNVSPVDAKLLGRLSEPLSVQSIAQDLRFLSWRGIFQDIGLQSYVLVKISQHQGLGEFLLIGADLPRTWSDRDCETLLPIAQAIGKVVTQRSQGLQTQQQQQLMMVLTGLRQLQQQQNPKQLFAIAIESMHQFLAAECLIILRWSLESPTAEIECRINHSALQIEASPQIPWQTDSFLQMLLEVIALKGKTSFPGVALLRGAVKDLAKDSDWISGPGFLEVLGVPLQAQPDQPFLGLVLALNTRRKGWSTVQREGFQILAREIASHACMQQSMQQLAYRCEALECLNWYKQRQVEQVAQLWIHQPDIQDLLLNAAAATAPSTMKGRSQSSLLQLKQAFTALDTMLKTEIWELDLEGEVVSIATILRRALGRIESVVRARQLWTQVHNLTPSVSVKMPSQKLDQMITELLLASCYRTKIGDRIDIWCRALQDNWVEVSITDNGRLNPKLVKDLTRYAQTRLPVASLEIVPGLHYKVCQSLVERLGGQLELTQLEDGRSLSRLILPTVPQN